MKFLPGRHLIDSFGNGGFRFGALSHQGSILILPSGIRASDAITLGDITDTDTQSVMAEKAEIDFLLIGTGRDMMRLPPKLASIFAEAKISVDAMNTNAAVRTYNVQPTIAASWSAAMTGIAISPACLPTRTNNKTCKHCSPSTQN
jgi:uncharacterized protein